MAQVYLQVWTKNVVHWWTKLRRKKVRTMWMHLLHSVQTFLMLLHLLLQFISCTAPECWVSPAHAEEGTKRAWRSWMYTTTRSLVQVLRGLFVYEVKRQVTKANMRRHIPPLRNSRSMVGKLFMLHCFYNLVMSFLNGFKLCTDLHVWIYLQPLC